jgi:His/Glu/Gln/Arg/opine family amino acid ABC transporter permease subunit
MEWKFGLVFEHLDFLLRGAWVTIQVSVVSMLVALVLGLLVAFVRLSPWWILRALASLYIDILRSTPLLAQLVWVFFALPILTGYALSPFVASTIALSVYTSAYLAEIFRAGILSISTGQRHAGAALGMTPTQVMRRVVLPQGIVHVLPPLGSQLINLFKDSALVSLVSLQDLMWSGQSLASITLRTVEVLTVVALIYMVLTIPQAMFVNFLHARFGQH